MPEQKNFVGNGWAKTFNNGGTIINISLKLDDLNKIPTNEKGYIRLVVAQRREPNDSGSTHYVYEDTYKAQPKAASVDRNLPESTSTPAARIEDDLPFIWVLLPLLPLLYSVSGLA